LPNEHYAITVARLCLAVYRVRRSRVLVASDTDSRFWKRVVFTPISSCCGFPVEETESALAKGDFFY